MNRHLRDQVLIGVLLAVFLGIGVYLFDSREAAAQPSEDAQQRIANVTVRNIVYAKDSRTGICFALSLPSAYQASGIAVVPEEKIPKGLSRVVKH